MTTNSLLLAEIPSEVIVIGVIVLVVLFFFSLLILLAKNYKRCPSNQVLVIYGKTGKGQAATTIHGGAAFVWPLIQDYALPEPRADPDRDPAARRAVDREHPRQRAERVHRGHRHDAGRDDQRRDPPAGALDARRSASRPRTSSSASCAR